MLLVCLIETAPLSLGAAFYRRIAVAAVALGMVGGEHVTAPSCTTSKCMQTRSLSRPVRRGRPRSLPSSVVGAAQAVNTSGDAEVGIGAPTLGLEDLEHPRGDAKRACWSTRTRPTHNF